jgi:sugar lactone lactonase YvrE
MIYVFEASGRVLSTHPTPADRPTNCTFAEAGRRVLYVTFGGGELYRVTNTGLSGDL